MASRKVLGQHEVIYPGVTVEYPDGEATGDVVRTPVGILSLWTGRALRSLPPSWRPPRTYAR